MERFPDSDTHWIDVFAGGGVAGATASEIDWSRTAVGPIQHWPASLRTIVGVIFNARHPMFLWWGPELIQFYNDGYIPSFGTGRHPTAMGQRGRECWSEIWPIIGPQIESVMKGGSTYHEDQLVPILRNGKLEDVYWTYGYSPVYADAGVGGVLVVVTETTVRVTAERRLVAARLLGERIRAPNSDMRDAFAGMTLDLPFSIVFTVEAGVRRVVASTGLTAVELTEIEPFFRERMLAPETDLISGLPIARADIASEVYFAALDTPEHSPLGFVAFGINPKLRFDAAYHTHLKQLTQTLTDARAQQRLRDDQETARRGLEISDRMASVGTLAMGMAHEINNPLTSINANLEMILEQLRSVAGGSPSNLLRELEEMIIEARVGAERVGKIVRGLKTFARTGDERPSRIEIRPVIELAINMAFSEIRNRARLVKDYGVTPIISADDARLGHVFIVLARSLRDHDLTVVTRVVDALAAIEAGKHFDIILSDLMLPEMTGMELYDRVRQLHPEIVERIVFVTGGAATPAAHAFLERIPNERIYKPFTVQAVRDLVQRFAEERKT